ncbi:hypothetical protein [Thiocapsa sp.]|uniref:hypothetical protein n=1 Tax=Thiocapsa sp. TaxID=2024551 RepID=UPI0025EF3D30|nr:hypothetical protein [Thiocapsa sp.]
MADISTFPIPTETLDPAAYPEFIGPATDWQFSETHLQARPVGGDTWVDVVALADITGPTGDAGAAGTPGADGNTILSGDVDPTDEGVDGNFYINKVSWKIFGPKATTWPAGVSLKGADGADFATPITTATITAGDLATPLDNKIYHVALTSDVDGDWTAPIPSGGDDATTGFYATVIFNPPGTGEGSGAGTDGPWIAPFPVGWNQVSGLDSVSLAPGDDPIVCSLASVGDGVILVSAVAAVEIAA